MADARKMLVSNNFPIFLIKKSVGISFKKKISSKLIINRFNKEMSINLNSSANEKIVR